MFPAILFLSASLLNAGESGTVPKPEKIGQMPRSVPESSGLARGRKHPGRKIFWTLNDSGNGPSIFAVDDTGKLLREVPIPNATNVDWEDLAIDEQGRLVIADIGDNHKRHDSFTLCRLPEPDALDPREKIAPPEVFRFKYPGEKTAYNAEALFVRGDWAYLLTKDAKETLVFALPLSGGKENEVRAATLLTTQTGLGVLTGAAISDDGRHVALLSYASISVYDFAVPFDKQPLADSPPPEKAAEAFIAGMFKLPPRTRIISLGQQEAIAWDGPDLVLTTEGGAIYRSAGAAQPDKK
jgi:hypothetical protein